MADIRKRDYKSGSKYQVRHPSSSTKSGYAYRTFDTLKEARAFLESGKASEIGGAVDSSIALVSDAIERWLEICEKEGTDGNDPVTSHTLETYRYFSKFMSAYPWAKPLQELTPPDIVKFRSWLMENCPSRYIARRSLTYFHTVMKEMALRGYIAANPASGISISAGSRYDTPITPPTEREFYELLAAADRLANSKNAQIARAWERNRPMLYLAGDTGMRPGEYLALARSNLGKDEVKVDRAVERSGKRISVTKTPAGHRWIEISPEIADMVRHYADHIAPPNKHDLVFPTKTGRWQTVNNWRRLAFTAACIEAGLAYEADVNGRTVVKPKFTPYDLRHFYASMLIEQRVNLKRIQQLMGHRNITTTLSHYGHLIERAEANETNKKGLMSRLRENSCGQSVANQL